MTFKEYLELGQYIDDDLTENLAPILLRKQHRAKHEALVKLTKGEFFKWDIKERARFLSKWEFKALPGGKGKFVRRQKPMSVADMIKKMKKASKTMKKNKKIQKAGLRKRAMTKGIG